MYSCLCCNNNSTPVNKKYLTTYKAASYIYIYVSVCPVWGLTPLSNEFFNITTMLYISLGLDTSLVYSRAAVSQHIMFCYNWTKDQLLKRLWWSDFNYFKKQYVHDLLCFMFTAMRVCGHAGSGSPPSPGRRCSFKVVLLQGAATWWWSRFSAMRVLETRPKAGSPASINTIY